MSNLKNTYGFSSSLLDTIRNVHETSKEEVESVDEAMKEKEVATRYYKSTPEGKSEARNKSKASTRLKTIADKLKQRYGESKKTNEEVELDEISRATKASYTKKAADDLYVRTYTHAARQAVKTHAPERSKEHQKSQYTSGHYDKWQSDPVKIRNRLTGIHRAAKEEVELDEADHTYPFKANQLAPLVVQLRALLNFLSKSGALKKSMREHAELVEAYIGEEITEEQLEEMISFVDDLMEGRPKGSKNKSKMASASKPEARAEKGESEEDEDYEDVHPAASRDGRHIIPELNAAAGDKKGASVQTSGGQRHVSQHVAGKMVSHLMSLKPAERGEHSAHIFNGSVPKVKTLNHVKTNVLIKQMGSEKKIGSDAGVKRGRGRPKKAV